MVLTSRAIPTLLDRVDPSFKPDVQVLQVGAVGTSGRYRLHISDGEFYTTVLLATALNARVSSIRQNQIIRIDQYQTQTGTGNRPILILNSFTDLGDAAGGAQIGSPQSYSPGVVPSTTSATTVPKPVIPQVQQNQPVNPYGQQQAPAYGLPAAAPYGQPVVAPYGQPSATPYGQPQPAAYAQPAANPYGQAQQPAYTHPTPAAYGQPQAAYAPAGNPYGQPQPSAYAQPAANPYGQPAAAPYGQPQASPAPQPSNPYSNQQQPAQGYPRQLAAHSSNPYSTGVRKQGPVKMAGVGVVPISELSIYTKHWTIKARVSAKTEIKTFRNARGEGQLFSADLMDAAGDDLRVSFFGAAVDKFYDLLQIGKVFTFSGGAVKQANPKFNPRALYEVTFDEHAEISESPDDTMIPAVKFNAVSRVSSLQQSQVGEMVDVSGVVLAAADLSKVVIKSTGQEKSRRSLTIVDDTFHSIDVTIWGDKAEALNTDDLAQHPVVFFKSCKVGDFGGRSLALVGSSQMEFNPDHARAFELKAWWLQNQGRPAPIVALTTSGGGVGGDDGDKQRVSIQALRVDDQQNLGPDKKPSTVHSVRATVVHIPVKDANIGTSSSLYYRACTFSIDDGRGGKRQCSKKAENQGTGQWGCAEGHVTDQPEARFILSMRIQDPSGELFVRAFNEQARAILGIDANHLDRMSPEELAVEQQKAVDNAVFSTFLFKLRSKREIHMDEEKVNVVVLDATPVAPVADAAAMLPAIKSYLARVGA